MSDVKLATWRMVLEERQDILAFLRSLTPEQWEAPSLCEGWRIKDVAAHLLVDEPVQSGMVMRVLPLLGRGRFSVNRTNEAWIAQNRNRAPDSILDTFYADGLRPVGWIGRVFGPGMALRALVIHHQDMRRPLHLERVVPPDRLRAALACLVSRKGSISIGSMSRTKGLCLRALDLDWSHGHGLEVCGPGESIVMALAGRGVALKDLTGEGKHMLAVRISAPRTNP